MKTPSSLRPTLAELLSPEETVLLEQTIDEVLREHWGPDRYEAYTQPRPVPAELTPLPLTPESPSNAIGGDKRPTTR